MQILDISWRQRWGRSINHRWYMRTQMREDNKGKCRNNRRNQLGLFCLSVSIIGLYYERACWKKNGENEIKHSKHPNLDAHDIDKWFSFWFTIFLLSSSLVWISFVSLHSYLFSHNNIIHFWGLRLMVRVRNRNRNLNIPRKHILRVHLNRHKNDSGGIFRSQVWQHDKIFV